MGLFGLGKKREEPFSKGISPDAFNGMQGMQSNNQNFGNTFNDPMNDPNSGLKLADLNSPMNNDFNYKEQQGVDSFGNPRVQPRIESYESRPQQFSPTQDTSKDMQLILAKLDAIRSEITNINHRLDNIERHQQDVPQKKYPW